MRKLLLVLFWALLPLLLCAQQAVMHIEQNRLFAASNYCIYPDSIYPDTPPPAGKRPFYISHYGRHGSRYLNNRKAYDIPYKMLCEADSMDELTPIGQDVLREMKAIINDAEGRWGELTDIGKRQQEGIARRMMERFPEVFEGKAIVDARSTIVNRCILSMERFVQQMEAINAMMQITTNASKQDMWYLNHQDYSLRDSMMTQQAKTAFDIFSKPRKGNPRLMDLLFVDSAYVSHEIDEAWLNYFLLKTALIQQNTPMSHQSNLLELFSYEDIHQFWQCENAWWYISYGPSLLNGGHQPYTQRYLLRHIIQEADSIMQLNTHGASLRFGHETVVLPLTCLLGINGFDYQTLDLESLESNGWWACQVFPMASNIQFVFYRSSPQDKDIVFKVLLNEKEATLPLASDIAPYYHWNDFRQFYLRKLDNYESSLSAKSQSVHSHLPNHGKQAVRTRR